MKDYITKNDTIIFSPEFNKPLNQEILSNYKKIIFSSYELNDGLFEAYENNNFNGLKLFGSNFNQPLGNSLNNLTSLTHLSLGYRFNQPLGNSLDNLTSLTHLTLGHNFNQKDDLPFNIISISLDCNNSYYIDYLPNSIEEIELGFNFDLKLVNLPSSIKKITFNKNSKYNKELNCLSNGSEILQLPRYYNYQILNIPIGLKKVICFEDYKFIKDFANLEVETY